MYCTHILHYVYPEHIGHKNVCSDILIHFLLCSFLSAFFHKPLTAICFFLQLHIREYKIQGELRKCNHFSDKLRPNCVIKTVIIF